MRQNNEAHKASFRTLRKHMDFEKTYGNIWTPKAVTNHKLGHTVLADTRTDMYLIAVWCFEWLKFVVIRYAYAKIMKTKKMQCLRQMISLTNPLSHK